MSAGPGDRIGERFGRFEIVGLLGRGGMGVVYRAEDTTLRRPVALKLLPADRIGDPERRHRFLREARAAASLTDPHIATVYDAGEEGEHLFLAMELCEGRSLRALLSERIAAGHGGLAIADVLGIGVQIARGLARAHAAGIVHRDVKPENVVVSDSGAAKLLDFGLAKLQPREDVPTDIADTASAIATEEGRVLGTPGYMPPEQARGRAVDARSDVFSLGVTLFELAAGRRPFEGRGLAATIAIDRDEAPLLGELVADAPRWLEETIARCLAKDPADRPRTAAEVVAALEDPSNVKSASKTAPDRASVSGAAVSAGRTRSASGASARSLTSGGSRASSAEKRRRRGWWVGAAGVIAGVALAAFASSRYSRQGDEPVPSPSVGSASVATRTASPLSEASATLACPVLEASGVQEPAGWLGASAANLACVRAAAILGGASERVLPPARLLDLPKTPTDNAPDDPFGAADARSRSLTAAASRAQAYIDGSIVRGSQGFRVELILRDATGREIARGQGEGFAQYQAVRAAMVPIVTSGGLPPAAAVDARAAPWAETQDPVLLLALVDWQLAVLAGVGAANEREKVEPRKQEVLATFAMLSRGGMHAALDSPAESLRVPLDRSTAASFSRTALAQLFIDPSANAAALADEIAALAQKDGTPRARTLLGVTEANLRMAAGDAEAARRIALRVVSDDPYAGGWSPLLTASTGAAGYRSTARAYTTWNPDELSGWYSLAQADGAQDQAANLRFMRRAFETGPGWATTATLLGMTLVRAGEREEARAMAARLAGGDSDSRFASELMLAEVETSEARFGAALERMRKLLAKVPSLGDVIRQNDYILSRMAFETAFILGRERELADELVDRFVLAEPIRVRANQMGVCGAVPACALATPARRAPCFARLRTLLSGAAASLGPVTFVLLDGAERYAKGDFKGAAAIWRKTPEDRILYATIVADAFARAGEPELAERTDARWLASSAMFHGADNAHVRAARRALARDDKGQARAMAQAVIDAWAEADEPVPVVQEMRELLLRLK